MSQEESKKDPQDIDIDNLNPVESGINVPVPENPASPQPAAQPEEDAKIEPAPGPLDIGVKELLGKATKSKFKAQFQNEEQTKLNELRLSFKASLAKLTETNTKEVGMSELQKIINENATPQALRIYLGMITEGHKHVNTNGKELYVLLLGYIAKAYKKQLLDPIDKPANLIKSVTRMCEIVHKYLTESSSIVHHACALTLIKIYEHCMIDQPNDLICAIFYQPLEAIIRGGTNKMAQMGAAHCINEFFTFLAQKSSTDLLMFFLLKYLALFVVFYNILNLIIEIKL